jgi:DNA-binding MarR family transcriptional regulator
MKRVIAKKVETRGVREANRAMDSLRRIVRALRVGNIRAEAVHGVSSAQLFALRAIDSEPGGSLRDLAARTLTSQSTVSEVAARLVAQGLVTRVASPDDRRRIELTVSAEGRQILQAAPATIQERLAAGFLSLSPDQQITLADGMEAWIVSAGLSGTPAAMFFEDRKE